MLPAHTLNLLSSSSHENFEMPYFSSDARSERASLRVRNRETQDLPADAVELRDIRSKAGGLLESLVERKSGYHGSSGVNSPLSIQLRLVYDCSHSETFNPRVCPAFARLSAYVQTPTQLHLPTLHR